MATTETQKRRETMALAPVRMDAQAVLTGPGTCAVTLKQGAKAGEYGSTGRSCVENGREGTEGKLIGRSECGVFGVSLPL
jgi:hypothetical protein